MRSRFISIPVCLIATACAGGSGAREHDAMVAALVRAERERAPSIGEDVALGAESLDRAALVTAVLARNPDLDAARATWRAATAGFPSAVAIDDPMLTYEIAPFSIGANVPFGQLVALSQKLPYPGKRRAAGDAAIADAEAARADYGALRLELAETTVHAFDDYYVAARALEVSTHHRELLDRIQKSATAQYTVGKASQQDPLEAEATLIALDRERLMLETRQRTAVARINRLLRRRANAPLPPPPAKLDIVVPAEMSVTRHPKLIAAEARIRERTAEIEGARRELYPDVELMASYESMWTDWQHRYMVGVAIEIPLQRSRRRASVERAQAEQAKATAELTSVADVLDEDRDRARREVTEARAALDLDEQRSLPTARSRVDAALAGFTSGQNPFSAVVMAEHALRDVELRIEQTRADLDRRIATLDRLSGRIAGGGR
jgi:cobalt-zinc-cadmium efflux system outer membrane protein